MEERITIKQWIENFNKGQYNFADRETQCNAGWYDWFCKDTSLANKTKIMGNIIKKITNEQILNGMYVFFKNNCPCSAPLYDQFKFCDIKTGNVIYCIDFNDKRDEHKFEVYSSSNKFENSIAGFNTSKELVNWFNNK